MAETTMSGADMMAELGYVPLSSGHAMSPRVTVSVRGRCRRACQRAEAISLLSVFWLQLKWKPPRQGPTPTSPVLGRLGFGGDLATSLGL